MITPGRSDAVSKVHVVFKTHLDVGFTDLAGRVVSRYVHRFIPAALDVCDALRKRGGDERFVWTTGSWLVSTALERSAPPARRRLEAAMERGDVVWHALPMTFHSELLSPGLFAAGLGIARRLDTRFGRRTIAAKMTDVPGHTRGIVPLLAHAGVALLHVGVNRASPLPRVPPVFVWRHEDGSEVIVVYAEGYGASAGAPGHSERLHLAHTEDNVGPPDAASVIATFARLRAAYPEAIIEASTLDAFAGPLLRAKRRLPVVTAEIGDTWIHGAASDPMKLAQLRTLARLRETWIARDGLTPDGPVLRRLNESLLLLAEHTWGLDAKSHLLDWTSWDAASFRRARRRSGFRRMEQSWREQRGHVRSALRSLGATHRGREAATALRQLIPRSAARRVGDRIDEGAILSLRHFDVQIDAATGAIVGLRDRARGRAWADFRHPLGWLRYQTFSARDVERNLRRYNVGLSDPDVRWWALADFGKPGLARAKPESRVWQPQCATVHAVQAEDADRFLVLLDAPPQARLRYGCPARFELELTFPHEAPRVDLELRWFDKRATRLPEALWLSFVPRVRRGASWWLHKMGTRVDPRDVVARGGRGLHAIERGVSLEGDAGALEIASADAALVAPGRLSLLDFGDALPRAARGMHFLLQNNVWGTNFPLWYEDDARLRFTLAVGPTATLARRAAAGR